MYTFGVILGTLVVCLLLGAVTYSKLTDYGVLPDDQNMSGPGY